MSNKTKIISAFLAIMIILIVVIMVAINNTKPKSTYDVYEIEETKSDSILNMSYDMENIVYSIFSNQGYKLPQNISFHRISNNSIIEYFHKNTIYVYVSPLDCWSCVKSINKQLISIVDANHLVYLISSKFCDGIDTFLDYSEISSDKAYFIYPDLGLPIEESNKTFLFTINDNNLITNVFQPTKYSQKITKAYINSIFIN